MKRCTSKHDDHRCELEQGHPGDHRVTVEQTQIVWPRKR